jgi:predicted CoA-binding protein
MTTRPVKTVAVIGASTDRRKFGNKGLRAFQAAGWRVYPVNPRVGCIEDLASVGSVAQITEPLDVVSLYVPANVGLKLLADIAAREPGEVWVNPGAESDALLAAAARAGLVTVRTCSIVALGFTPADFPDA